MSSSYAFIDSFYDAKDRPRLARELLSERDFSPDRFQFAKSLASTLHPDDKEELVRHAELDALRCKAVETRRRMEQVIDFSKLAPATLAFNDLREKLMALIPEGLDTIPDQFAEEVLGDRQMFMRGERERLAASSGKLSEEKIRTILRSIDDAKRQDTSEYGKISVTWFNKQLSTGQLRSAHDQEDWNRLFLKAVRKNSVQLLVDSIEPRLGCALSADAICQIRSFLRPESGSKAWQWYNWAFDLTVKLGLHDEAAVACRTATKIEPRNAYAWNGLGNFFRDHFGRFEESEAAYRRAIEIDPRSAYPWNGLGTLLKVYLGRFEESESAYLNAIEIDPRSTRAWNGLGNLYCDHLRRYSDAARAFARAVAIDGSDEFALQNLVFLQRDFFGDLKSARETFETLAKKTPRELKDAFHLHSALFAAYDANWGLCKFALGEAIEVIDRRFPARTQDDWFRTSAILLHLNYGGDVLAFLRKRGDNIRFRPWFEALSALHQGDRRFLQNIPVEVRTTAEYYFDQIEKRLNALPEKTRRRPAPMPPKKRRKRSRAL